MALSQTDLDAAIAALTAQIDTSLQAQGAVGTRTVTDFVKAELLAFTYGAVNPLSTPKSVNHLSYNNDTAQAIRAKFPVQTTTTTATFQFSFTEGVKLTAKETFKVGVPPIADSTTTIGLELSFSATQTVTKSVSESWTYDEPVPVPARSKVCAFLLIDQDTYDPPFTAKIKVSGGINVDYRKAASGSSNEWSQTEGLVDYLKANAAQYPNVTFEGTGNDMVAVIAISGTFKGVSGSNVRIDVTQYAVDTPCPAAYAALAGPSVEA